MEPQPGQEADTAQEDQLDPRQAQANKLFQTAVMLIYGRRKSVEKAIKCVQRAIVIDDSNYKFWQLLGEAYYQRGSLNPAINCFMKSLERAEKQLAELELNDEERTRVRADCTYSRLRMSDIRLSVLHLEEAMQGYSDIIDSEPKNVAALTGLSRTQLQIARGCFSKGLVLSGHQHCMEALKFALRATCLCPHLCFTWKLAADCCLIQILFGQRGQFRSIIDVPEYPGAQADGLVIDQVTCIELAQQFLCKALAIERFKDSACLWHNLGISLYLKSTLLKSNDTKQLDIRRALLRKSLKCLFKALDFDRVNSQSFLIKSIQTNMSTSEMQFSNLGYIYLQKGEFRLASVAFKRSQAEEPLYCRSWLGNALISEQSNIDNMTFLRHCHKLENNYESQLMYATRVASLTHNDESVTKDLTSALDCMKRLINYDQGSIESQNTLGLLMERCRFQKEARKCFEIANVMAPNDSRVLYNKLRQIRGSENEQPDFVKNAEKIANSGSRDQMLNFIFHLFRVGNFKDVNPKVTKVIEKLAHDNLKDKIGAQVLLAMADKVEGRDFKSWLFKNIIDSEDTEICIESLISLFCLMLFGSMKKDDELVKQIGSDLMKRLIAYLSTRTVQFVDLYYSLEGYWTRLLLFSSIFINQTNLIRPLVALFPMVPDFWLYLGLSLIFHKSKLETARYCIEKASLIGPTDSNLTSVCDVLLATISSQRNDKQVAMGSTRTSAMSLRQVHLSRAVFKCPDNELLWKCLYGTMGSDLCKQDNELFQFAMDHTLQSLIIR